MTKKIPGVFVVCCEGNCFFQSWGQENLEFFLEALAFPAAFFWASRWTSRDFPAPKLTHFIHLFPIIPTGVFLMSFFGGEVLRRFFVPWRVSRLVFFGGDGPTLEKVSPRVLGWLVYVWLQQPLYNQLILQGSKEPLRYIFHVRIELSTSSNCCWLTFPGN